MVGRTDVGRSRARNEDALLQRPDRGLVAVADGMGGHAAGDIASRIAVDVVDDRTAHLPDQDQADYLGQTVVAAHDAILRAARADPELSGMGTTLTLLRVDPGTGRGHVVHVGDSRAYLWRDGRLDQLTRDQTWVQDQVDAGLISPTQAHGHPFSAMLTGALGIEDVELEVEVVPIELRPDDVCLLCSDGLMAGLDDDRIAALLRDHDDLDRAAEALVQAANEAGGPDNITVALVRLES